MAVKSTIFELQKVFFTYFWGSTKFLIQWWWFNGSKKGGDCPPPLTRPENGIPVYTILTCLSIVKGGGTDFVQDMTF